MTPDSSARPPKPPVSEAEARALFAPLERFERLALAVSGGSDSTALLWLMARWARDVPDPPELHVLSVDHGLRPDSAAEARAVKHAAEALGVAAATLRWRGEKPATGLQAAARQARYRLMADWCARHAVPALLTAHTLDDQAETFLMRLGRGSGLDGLAAMGDTRWGATLVLRPLLALPRQRLRATLAAAGVAWSEDPSNADDRFERARVRKALALLEREGLTAPAIALAARRLARARIVLEAAADRLLAETVAFDRPGHARMDAAAYDGAPAELRLRVLREVLRRIGGEAPEMAALERLVEALEGEAKARTLAGCRVSRRSGALVVERAAPRRQPKQTPAH